MVIQSIITRSGRLTSICLVLFFLIAGVSDGKIIRPGSGEEYETFTERIRKTHESDIKARFPKDEIRPDTVHGVKESLDAFRKASKDKKPWAHNDFNEMEEIAWPHFDISFPNWDYPDMPWWPGFDPWPTGPYGPQHPDDILDVPGWYLHGCWISCFPGIIECVDGEAECVITTSQIICGIDVVGQVQDWRLEGNNLIIVPAISAVDNSVIEVEVCTCPLDWQLKGGCCDARIIINCEEEEEDICLGATPTIVADATTEAAYGDICSGGNTSGTFSVQSGGLAVPPYEWTLTCAGSNFTLDGQACPATAETSSDGSSVTVASSGACGGATLRVEDACGETDTYTIMCSDSGSWVTIYSTALGDPESDACNMPGESTHIVAGQMRLDAGYRRQYHNYITVGAGAVQCVGSGCGSPPLNDCQYDGSPGRCCGGGCPSWGCYDCLCGNGTLVGCAALTFRICDMCGCDDCWHITGGYYQCACNCSVDFVYQEWQCP